MLYHDSLARWYAYCRNAGSLISAFTSASVKDGGAPGNVLGVAPSRHLVGCRVRSNGVSEPSKSSMKALLCANGATPGFRVAYSPPKVTVETSFVCRNGNLSTSLVRK